MPKIIIDTSSLHVPNIFTRPTGLSLSQKILATRSASLVQYLPFSEALGSANAIDLSPKGNDAVYNTTTLGIPGIGDGLTAARLNGVAGFIDVYSAGLNTDFSGAEGTIVIWGRMDASVWTDGATRFMGQVRVDGANFVYIRKQVANNTILFTRAGGGVTETVSLAGINPTTYFMAAMTWSEVVDEVKAYYMDIVNPFGQVGATATVLGAWAGNLFNTSTNVGASTEAGGSVWDGDLAHWAAWNTPLTSTELENFTL